MFSHTIPEYTYALIPHSIVRIVLTGNSIITVIRMVMIPFYMSHSTCALYAGHDYMYNGCEEELLRSPLAMS